MSTENSISQESAEEQISLLEDHYEMEASEDCSIGKESYIKIRNRLVKHITKGRLEITNDEGALVVKQIIKTSEGDQELIYSEIGATAKLEMDKVSGNVAGMYAMAGSLTGKGFKYITKLKGKNLHLVENLTTFLAIE